jgi:hypothetical protein
MKRKTTTTAPASSGSVTETPTTADKPKANAAYGKVAFPEGKTLDVGDELRVTAGAETYPTEGGGSFTVGPYATVVTLRQGETAEQLLLRGWAIVEVAFEAGFEAKKKQHATRAAEVRK